MVKIHQKIIPHLWFNNEAKEAANFYVKLFGKNSKIENITTLHDTPSGDSDIVSFELNGYKIQAINAGPIFKLNPSISFILNFDPLHDANAENNINKFWDAFSDRGLVRMPIGEYPFSKRFGWIDDKFGVSWQLMLTDPNGEERPFIIPSILFVNDLFGKAEEAADFYMSVFKNSKLGARIHYQKNQDPNIEGKIMFSDFKLENQWFVANDGPSEHDFGFNEAFSFMVICDNQNEIDEFWEKLSAVPESEQCGWLKDKYGVSWQIVPKIMNEFMSRGTVDQINRVTQAFLPMKKFNIVVLQDAFDGK